jgi:hypothetical protein
MTTIKSATSKTTRKPSVAKDTGTHTRTRKVTVPVIVAKRHISTEPKYPYYYNQISNHNFELALLTQDGSQILHTVVQCKDYFQDMFWCEYNNVEGDVYGLSWKPGMIDTNAEFHEMALFGGSVLMEPHAENLQKLINYFDEAQGFPLTTVTTTDNKKIIIVKFSREWTTAGPLLSALTSIIRISGSYIGQDPIVFFTELLRAKVAGGSLPGPVYSHVDISRLPVIFSKLMALLHGSKVVLPWSDIKSTGSAHNTGICGWAGFPTWTL